MPSGPVQHDEQRRHLLQLPARPHQPVLPQRRPQLRRLCVFCISFEMNVCLSGVPCANGTFGDTQGKSDACGPCQPGFANNQTGQSQCLPCSVSFVACFPALISHDFCFVQAGYYSNLPTGAFKCLQCPHGKFSAAKSDVCTDCLPVSTRVRLILSCSDLTLAL